MKTEGSITERVSRGRKSRRGNSFLLESYGPRIISGDMDPGFFIDFFIKDMKLGYEAGQESGLELSALKLAMEEYQTLNSKGFGREGMQALIRYYEK